MPDIELVIKIPEDSYKATCNGCMLPPDVENVVNAIRNGTVLPKGHGRLIDADRLTRAEIMHLWYHLPNGDIACPKVDMDNAPTIIEGSESE